MRKLLGCGALIAVLALGDPSAPSSLRPEDILGHLELAISWYRHITSEEPASATTGDLLLRENTRESALQAVRLAFDFARAEAALLATNGRDPAAPQSPSAAGGSSSLQQAADKAANRVNGVQTRIAAVDASLQKADGKQRATLVAQRDELAAELDLAKEIQRTTEDMLRFSGTIGGSGLMGKIGDLERSVPEAQPRPRESREAVHADAPAANPAPAAAAPRTFDPQSAGILGLTAGLYSMHSTEAQIRSLAADTDALVADIERLKVPLVNEARASIERSDQITSGTNPSDPGQLAAAQRELDGLSLKFKQLSTAIVPLGDEEIAVDTARADLVQELSGFDAQYRDAGRYLLVRVGTLGIVLAIMLFVSELWRRATLRYVHDARRRRQFSVLRRIVVGCAVTLAVILGFVTEFGSLATYAGFVTAGLALALQNVILSMVAYFFLIGRFGIRVGDRVTISNVTGDVIDIGLVRITMMELGADLHSTGRIVVYSNSVIFQPSALFKQIPGINYVWHMVTLTLSADSDFQIAEKKLTEAVDAVYQKYRAAIEEQHVSFEQSVDIEIKAPTPETRVRFSDAGLVFSVRYPAQMDNVSATDDQIMRALWDTIENEPKLKFASSGSPKLQPVN